MILKHWWLRTSAFLSYAGPVARAERAPCMHARHQRICSIQIGAAQAVKGTIDKVFAFPPILSHHSTTFIHILTSSFRSWVAIDSWHSSRPQYPLSTQSSFTATPIIPPFVNFLSLFVGLSDCQPIRESTITYAARTVVGCV